MYSKACRTIFISIIFLSSSGLGGYRAWAGDVMVTEIPGGPLSSEGLAGIGAMNDETATSFAAEPFEMVPEMQIPIADVSAIPVFDPNGSASFGQDDTAFKFRPIKGETPFTPSMSEAVVRIVSPMQKGGDAVLPANLSMRRRVEAGLGGIPAALWTATRALGRGDDLAASETFKKYDGSDQVESADAVIMAASGHGRGSSKKSSGGSGGSSAGGGGSGRGGGQRSMGIGFFETSEPIKPGDFGAKVHDGRLFLHPALEPILEELRVVSVSNLLAAFSDVNIPGMVAGGLNWDLSQVQRAHAFLLRELANIH